MGHRLLMRAEPKTLPTSLSQRVREKTMRAEPETLTPALSQRKRVRTTWSLLALSACKTLTRSAAVAGLVLLQAGSAVAGVGGGGQTPLPVFSLPPSLSCAGTVTLVGGQHWGYVIWNASDASWLNTHDVAVWLKPAGGSFTLQGVMSLMSDAQAIRTWMPRAAALGDDLGVANFLAGELLRQWKADTPFPNDLADKLSMLGGRARQNTESAAALRQMGNSRPSFRFVSGTGWAGPLGAARGQEAVIELRERNPATGEEGGVVGRVVLIAGQVEVLAAPGAPVQVPPNFLQNLPVPSEGRLYLPMPNNLDNQPDLGVALRWAVPEALRRQILLTRGFMVWRLPAGSAPQSNASMLATLARDGGKLPTDPGEVRALARVPGPAIKLFASTGSNESGPDVANFTLDAATLFMCDDNARFATAANNPSNIIGVAYAEGEVSQYYVAVVDLLGRYGPLSTLGTGVAVHTVPPDVPDVTRVESIMKPDVGSGLPSQRLRVVWKPNPNAEGEVATTHYLVFRDRTANSVAKTNALDRITRPAEHEDLIYLGVVEHPVATESELFFDDDMLMPAPGEYGRPYFYCIRAAHLGPLGYNLSSPSPAVFGTLRDREGPPPPSGSVAGDCPRAGFAFDGAPVADVPAPVAPEVAVLHVVIHRGTEDGKWKEVEWVQLQAGTNNDLMDSPRLYFGRNDRVWFDFVMPKGRGWHVVAKACTPLGRISYPVSINGLAHNCSLAGSTHYNLTGRALGAPVIGMATPGQPLSQYWEPFFNVDESETVCNFSPAESIEGTLRGSYDLSWVNSQGKHASLLVQSKRTLIDPWRNSATSLLAPTTNSFHFSGHLPSFLPGDWRVWRVVDPPDSPDPILCPHTAYPKGAGKVQPILVTLNIPAGAREYRLYRRIDAGDLMLCKQATGLWDNQEVTVLLADGLIPQAGGAIRYYGQTLDQHGNPSALVLLGEKLSEAKLPVPLLNKPISTGNINSPKVRIQASCPSSGVKRLTIEVDPPVLGVLPDWIVPQSSLPKLSFNLDASAGVSKPFLSSQTLTTAAKRFADNNNGAITLDIELPVLSGIDYTISVLACGESVSNTVSSGPKLFTWSPPIVEGTVPWPARPVPQVVAWNSSVKAFQTRSAEFYFVSGGSFIPEPLTMYPPEKYPVAISIGWLSLKSDTPYPNDPYSNWKMMTTTYGNVLGFSGVPRFEESPAPADLFHKYLYAKVNQSAGGSGVYMPDFSQTLFPFVLYRRQTARKLGSAVVPTPDTDITQVSPMIQRIAWMHGSGSSSEFAFLVDPFVGVLAKGGLHSNSPAATLCLFDNTPVAINATYHYYLMHFDTNFEPDQIIDAGEVTIAEEQEQ